MRIPNVRWSDNWRDCTKTVLGHELRVWWGRRLATWWFSIDDVQCGHTVTTTGPKRDKQAPYGSRELAQKACMRALKRKLSKRV